MASKGVTERHFCASVQRTRSRRGMPPRVFCRKSAEVVENKGRESEKERQESLRVRKRKELKEIEEIKGENPAGFVRDNTRNRTIDAVRLSIVNLSSTLRRAYGGQAALPKQSRPCSRTGRIPQRRLLVRRSRSLLPNAAFPWPARA